LEFGNVGKCFNEMYTEEEKFRQTEATVIKSTKNSEGKGRIEVLNIKVRFRTIKLGQLYLGQPGHPLII